ncbi:MAG: tyrosine-type recombinase/integrase [Ktedonobacterales bacterium]|nr:tyrosine-type recombinase/integrase [Ktedonobacterales bacterium]
MKITDAIEGFLLDRSTAKCSAATLRWYRYKLHMFADAMAERGVTDIEGIKVHHLRAFILELQNTVADANNPYKPARKDGNKLSDLTVRGFVQVIKTFCKWLYLEELLAEDPSLRLKRPKVASYMIRPFTAQNIEDMLDACDRRTHLGFRNYAMILLMCDTGIRLGELCNLRHDDFHLGVGGDESYITVFGKGKKERKVGISPLVAKCLWKYTSAHRPSDNTKEQWVFLGKSGKPISATAVQQMLRQIKKEIGLEGVRVSPHTFRHTFSTLYMKAGGKLERLSRELGHSKLIVTEEYLKQFGSESALIDHERFSPIQMLHLEKRRPSSKDDDDGRGKGKRKAG